MHEKKSLRLYLVLACFFVSNALIAEMIGGKIFSLEKTLGITPFDFSFFGITHLSFNLTAGVILWPFVFILTDVINEYFGVRGVRFLSYLTAVLISYAFAMIFLAMKVLPADFWITTKQDIGIANANTAFNAVFGQGLWIILGSLVAFLVGQVIDVTVFHAIRRRTNERMMWIRSTVSTLISQLIDSFVVLFIAFYLGNNWSFNQVLAIAVTNYIFKLVTIILAIPFLYFLHAIIEFYLGKNLADELKMEAAIH